MQKQVQYQEEKAVQESKMTKEKTNSKINFYAHS